MRPWRTRRTAYFTDDWATYQGIADNDTCHDTVNHSAEDRVRGDVHTNTIEFILEPLEAIDHWGLPSGSCQTSGYAYLDELEWRFNNRDNPWLFRDTLLRLLDAKHVEYKELVA